MLDLIFGENVLCGGEVRDRNFGMEIQAHEEDGKKFQLSCTGRGLFICVVNTLDREFVLSVSYLHWLNQTMGDVVAYSTQHWRVSLRRPKLMLGTRNQSSDRRYPGHHAPLLIAT